MRGPDEHLSERQHDALADYHQLLKARPGLFTGRARRPIVRDPATLREFTARHQVVLGVVAATPYLWLINDLVRSRDAAGTETLHPYLRVIVPPAADADGSGNGGVVILATVTAPEVAAGATAGTEDGELIVLVEQERHSTGGLELELPRGFSEPGVAMADQALAELREETGYLGREVRVLGTTISDSGTSNKSASFVHVPVTGRESSARESSEAITRTVLLTRADLWRRIDSGAIRDAFTLQALALYERRPRIHGSLPPRPEFRLIGAPEFILK